MASEAQKIDQLVREIEAAQLPPPARRRRIRESAGVSLREAAATLDVAVMTFRRWESGRVEPRRASAIRYRQMLDALAEVTR